MIEGGIRRICRTNDFYFHGNFINTSMSLRQNIKSRLSLARWDYKCGEALYC